MTCIHIYIYIYRERERDPWPCSKVVEAIGRCSVESLLELVWLPCHDVESLEPLLFLVLPLIDIEYASSGWNGHLTEVDDSLVDEL